MNRFGDLDRFTRLLLRGNAIFCALGGVVAIAAAAPLARLLGPELPTWAMLLLGAILIAYAELVWIASGEPRRLWLLLITLADIVWVLASAALLLVAPNWLSAMGTATVIVVALAVAAFAAAEITVLARQRASIAVGGR